MQLHEERDLFLIVYLFIGLSICVCVWGVGDGRSVCGGVCACVFFSFFVCFFIQSTCPLIAHGEINKAMLEFAMIYFKYLFYH